MAATAALHHRTKARMRSLQPQKILDYGIRPGRDLKFGLQQKREWRFAEEQGASSEHRFCIIIIYRHIYPLTFTRIYSPPPAVEAASRISSRHSFIPKPSDYCSGCETTHARNEFSPWQRAARTTSGCAWGARARSACAGTSTSTLAPSSRHYRRPPSSSRRPAGAAILRCEDESHLKGTRHHLERSARLDHEAMMPQVTVGVEDDGAVVLSTYFEELVCIVPAGEPLHARHLRQKLDLLQAASTNCICGHVHLNSECIVDLADSIDCPHLHEADGGAQVSAAAALSRHEGGGTRSPRGRRSEEGCCDMKDSIGFCDTCDDTWFGFRRWRGRPDAEYHEIWLFGLSYISFQGGFKPDCYAWRQRLD
ncbi:hypothetical protein PG994_007464 [Apiospora phragmitis]|uniref:Uncharacterized protein n=1 Tax=Apiospora phragmitis TaxID=2905665 RepID=A0ABR1V0Y3_9PEZI